MVTEHWLSRRQNDKETRADDEFQNKLDILVGKLKSKLKSKENEIIESIIIDSEKESGKFTYEGRKKAIKSFEDNELIKDTEDINISGIAPLLVIEDYIYYLKKKILLDFPEYKIKDIIIEYDMFIYQRNKLREDNLNSGSILPEEISDIKLFVRSLVCDKKRKKGIYNLLSLIKSIDLKAEREMLEEIEKERLKETLNMPSPKEKLIKSLGNEILNEFKESLKEEKELGQFFSLFELIAYCTNKINKEYNLRFSEEEKNILLEIGQKHLKRIKYK